MLANGADLGLDLVRRRVDQRRDALRSFQNGLASDLGASEPFAASLICSDTGEPPPRPSSLMRPPFGCAICSPLWYRLRVGAPRVFESPSSGYPHRAAHVPPLGHLPVTAVCQCETETQVPADRTFACLVIAIKPVKCIHAQIRLADCPRHGLELW
jgi:hypothetical protein